jgi:hypothetical protein
MPVRATPQQNISHELSTNFNYRDVLAISKIRTEIDELTTTCKTQILNKFPLDVRDQRAPATFSKIVNKTHFFSSIESMLTSDTAKLSEQVFFSFFATGINFPEQVANEHQFFRPEISLTASKLNKITHHATKFELPPAITPISRDYCNAGQKFNDPRLELFAQNTQNVFNNAASDSNLFFAINRRQHYSFANLATIKTLILLK